MDLAEHIRTKYFATNPLTFVGGWPLSEPNSIALRLWEGSTAEYFGQKSTSEPLLLVLVRHEVYATGSAWCKDFKGMFHQYSDELIAQMSLVGEILHLGKNAENLHEFQMTFKTIMKG